jgi:hypothetical protein
MLRKLISAVGGVLIAAGVVGIAVAGGGHHLGRARDTAAAPVFDPGNFTAGAPVTNTYFPLPIGRTLTYTGIKDGQTQRDVVTITGQTKTILGIRATVVHDEADHNGTLLEKTDDWYAQDDQGNVWYLGEDTAAYGKNGKVDTTGSWQAGVNGAVPGIIMEGNPQVPDAYRQEFLAGQAEDTAWIVDLGGTVTVPYGRVRNVLTTLEATVLEPGAYDQKVYGPGIGIVLEQALTGPNEVAKLVSVSGP